MSDKELSFMQELGEARMFKSRNQIEKAGARSLTDHLFVSLLGLYAMANDYKYAPVAKEYAKRTMNFGNFNRPSPSGTDLYQTMYSLQRPEELFNQERDSMLMDKVQLETSKIKRFLQQVKQGNINPATAQEFFFRLERNLKIQDPKLKAARRLTQDWTNLSSQQQQLVTTQIMRYFRMNARRSDLMPLYSSFAKDNNLVLNDKEKGSIAKKLAVGAAAGFAAGMAIGKATKL